MNTVQVAGYDHCSVTISYLKIINSQQVKKALFRGESFWKQQEEDALIILLSGDLAVQYVDCRHELTPGEMFHLHRLSYYRISSSNGADVISLGL